MVTVSGLLRGQGENQPKVLTKHVVWVSGREINTLPTDLSKRELRLQDQREGRRIRLGGWSAMVQTGRGVLFQNMVSFVCKRICM